ncbi:MAG: methyltransferase type 11 [Betaproteobacteria bacterium]|nr:methyltransferase type 11 [Betaproteobacteria bacterium]
MDKSLYQRPRKPTQLAVIRRGEVPNQAFPELPEIIEIDRFSECHVTPMNIAAQMVEYLGVAGDDYLTLEPSAGTGNLIHALYESGYSSNQLTVIERQYELCNQIRTRFSGNLSIDPIQKCFLEYAKEVKGQVIFQKIIMNPPFRAVKQHITAALSLLDGHQRTTLVALVPSTFNYDTMAVMEKLGNDTFPLAKVSTKIIRIQN